MRNWKAKEKYVQGKIVLIILYWGTKTERVRSIHSRHLVLIWISNDTAWKIYFFFVCWLYSKSVKNGTKLIKMLSFYKFDISCYSVFTQHYDVISYLKWHFKQKWHFFIWCWNRKILCIDRLHHLIQWLLFCLVGCHYDKHTTHCKIFFHQKLVQNLCIWLCQTTLSRIQSREYYCLSRYPKKLPKR